MKIALKKRQMTLFQDNVIIILRVSFYATVKAWLEIIVSKTVALKSFTEEIVGLGS